MKKHNQIMCVSVPVEDAADLLTRAARMGMPTDEYLGVLLLSGAYGALHPVVKAAKLRPILGQSGTETHDGES